MTPERITQIAAAFPWLPADYLDILLRVEAAPRAYRYGAQWFDGPQVPGAAFGASLAAQWPSALWIARRGGYSVGYAGWDSAAPRLYEWAASQRQVVQEFDSIAALVLSSILQPGVDSRPIVPVRLHIAGIALGPWHDAGIEWTARGILLPGHERGVLDALCAALPAGWTLCLAREDKDSWLSIRPVSGRSAVVDRLLDPQAFELCLDRHGSGGHWRRAKHQDAVAALLALAPLNGGAHVAHHALLTMPAAPVLAPHV